MEAGCRELCRCMYSYYTQSGPLPNALPRRHSAAYRVLHMGARPPSPRSTASARSLARLGNMAPFVGDAPNIVGAVVPLVLLGSIALPLRIYVRTKNNAWGWDDWCMVVATV